MLVCDIPIKCGRYTEKHVGVLQSICGRYTDLNVGDIPYRISGCESYCGRYTVFLWLFAEANSADLKVRPGSRVSGTATCSIGALEGEEGTKFQLFVCAIYR
jgi:hypothetical protein